MKFYPLVFLLFLVFGCRKSIDSSDQENKMIHQAKDYLRDQMNGEQFATLDWTNTMLIREPDNYLRVGIVGRDMAREFILVKFFNRDTVDGAKRITFDMESDSLLSGTMEVSAPDRSGVNRLRLYEGDIIRERPANGMAIVEDEGPYEPKMMSKLYVIEMPDRPYQIVEYTNISRAYNNAVPATSSSYYYSVSGPEQKNDYSGGGGGSSSYIPAPTILVDMEAGYLQAALNIDRFIQCFNSIPDNGAVCTIDILCDIPVDTDAQALFDWRTNSPGHTFLRLTKIYNGKVIVQHIGFYPQNSFKVTATTAPVAGKFVDNANHEYNAGMKMSITPAQLKEVLGRIKLTAKTAKYSIDKYNCTDFALSMFNSLRGSEPVEPPLVHIPNTMNITGSMTPQGLYLELFRLRKMNAKDRPFINFPANKTKAGPSILPCN